MLSRFVFISTCTVPWGGSEELWAGAAAVLAKAGHAVTVFKTGVDRNHPRIGQLRELGCPVRDLHKFCLPSWIPMPKSMQLVTAKRAAQKGILPLMRTHLAKINPDLLIISQGSNFDGLVYTELCRNSGRPYVIVSQKASEHLWPLDQNREAIRSTFHAAVRSYFVSQHNLELTQRQIAATIENAEIVRNPFRVSGKLLPWPKTENDSFRLACVARFETGEKGQDLLLQVLARQEWRSRNLSVSFFGAGVNREGLRELAAQLDLKNVSFPGFQTDVESIWKTHHALVLPSRAEGLPLALVEAMISGRLGIVTREGGSSEVVEDGRTGFVAESTNVDEFDKAMERAWAVREHWESIGKTARDAIQTMVPPDPAASFATKLVAAVDSLALNQYPFALGQSRSYNRKCYADADKQTS